MQLQATYQKHVLKFKFEAGTSRGKLTEKETYFIRITDQKRPGIVGLGECSPLKGLSIDDIPEYEVHLNEICERLDEIGKNAYAWKLEDIIHELIGPQLPSIQFGIETALLDLFNGGKGIVFPHLFTQGQAYIPVNGLIWMGDEEFMLRQIDEKLAQGFTCIKIKIGALNFEKECEILSYIRKQYPQQINLRVDANGAFFANEALAKLKILAAFNIHSIEQPIKQGQRTVMAQLCKQSPVPVALDEELIGVHIYEEKEKLLKQIRPHFIILKPSLLGGFAHCREWINLADKLNIGWWITSALESNVGLNAISQFTATLNNPLPQGLGTGQLFTNNTQSHLKIKKGFMYYDESKQVRNSIQ